MMVTVKARHFKRSILFLLCYVVVQCRISAQQDCGTGAVDCPEACVPSPRCCFSMNEETEVGVVVGNVNIVPEIKEILEDSDPDTSIEVHDPTGDISSVFLLNSSTGEVQVNSVVDREELAVSCIAIVVTVNNNSATLLISVGVVVVDINDHKPKFPEPSYSVEWEEERPLGTDFCINNVRNLEAHDDDFGSNGEIVYSIGGDAESMFTIFHDPEEGDCIQNTSRLDREEVEDPSNTPIYSLSFLLIASDNGNPPKQCNITLTIDLTDINDNPPVFTQDSLEPVSVKEDKEDGEIRVLNATDLDYNSELRYFLESQNVPFEIDPETGQLSVAAVDEELDINGYNLTIVVSDSENSDRKVLTVEVQDVNQRANLNASLPFPKIYEEELKEDYRFLYCIQDVDEVNSKDAYSVELIPGPYADRFSAAINMHTNLFTVSIELTSPIDQEALIIETGNTIIELNFTFTEFGDPIITQSQQITIPVIGINDNPPMLVETVFYFEEEQPPGTRIAELIGRDADSGDDGKVVSFCLLSAVAHSDKDLTSSFLMQDENRECNDVSLVAPRLDREYVENITITMNLTDGGGLSNNVIVTVHVTDINDNYPHFSEQNYKASFQEGREGVLVKTVKATDPDSGTNAEISYMLLDHVDEFTVDRVTGEVRTKVPFDREKQDRYTINIVAVNTASMASTASGSRNTTKIEITVTDINDNSPMWADDSPTEATISSDYPIGTLVFSLTATDDDIGDNALVSYKLEPSILFNITPNNGIIRVKANLENEIGSHILLVTAYNTHDPQRNTSRNMIIKVQEPSSSSSSFGGIVGSISGAVILIIAVWILMHFILL